MFGQAGAENGPQRASHKIPLLDLARENRSLLGALQAAIEHVCASGRFVLGPECQHLEEGIAALCDTRFAIGCASGSDALLLALMAIGIGPGDEVIVPSFTFFATASAVSRLGATPVFADIDPRTFNLDPASVARCVHPRTKGVIPVHLFGQCADMNPLRQLASERKLWLIEDAAQSIGATYHGQPAGSLGNIGCLSFYPTKNLGGFGDGGMLVTSDSELADRLRLLHVHGMRPRYHHQLLGINSRLDTLQAAILNVKLPYLRTWTSERQKNALRYEQLFQEAQLGSWLQLPTADGGGHVWNQYTIRIPAPHRDPLREYLTQVGIGTEIYYPVPLHRQPCFASLGYAPGSLPETERAVCEVLSLPIFPGLREDEQRAIVKEIGIFHRQVTRRAAA